MKRDNAIRVQKLQGLLARLKQEKNVQNRDLRTWLGTDGYAQYEADWEIQSELRVDLRDKPAEIVDYEDRLKRATFMYNRGDSYSQKGKHEAAGKLMAAASAEFERLIVYLEVVIAANPSLRMWFDREIDRETFGLTPGAVPMVVTSKSLLIHSKCAGLLAVKQSKRHVKIAAVERVLSEIEQSASGSGLGMRVLLAKRRASAINIHPERD